MSSNGKSRVRFADTDEFDEKVPGASIRDVKRAKIVSDEDKDCNYDCDDPKLSKKKGNKDRKKHTLDSDEEDDDYKDSGRLDVSNVEGQEDATEEYDGQTKIMPFNMKDDMEDGHFDEEGNFIFDKKEKVIRDAWLDNIEWDNAKNLAGKHWHKFNKEDEKNDEPEQKIDLNSTYTDLLKILKDDETISGALKRLNSERGITPMEERKRRWAAKKAGINIDQSQKSITQLTLLADSLVSQGQMEAYQLNPTRLRELLEEFNKSKTTTNTNISNIDMFFNQ